MQIIDGKKVSKQLRTEISEEVSAMVAAGKRAPHLAAVLIGNDPASETYVNAKVKACKAVGFNSTLVRKESSITQEELLQEVERLNDDPEIDGFIVQLPLPKHIDPKVVIEKVSPTKDVDGFHPVNVGKMALGLEGFVPATPGGILELLKRYSIETDGKHCVVVGRSNIVGGPMSILMRQDTYPGNCTVTIVHSHTIGMEDICLQADILIVAIGKPEYVTEDMVKEGAVVIDVGINRLADASTEKGYRLCGDVHFENVSPKCSYITPVPGGVGPMTIASLLNNTLTAAKRRG